MVTSARRALALLALALTLGLASPGAAEPPEAERIEEAKRLFRQGVELFGAGDRERALELFTRSRALYPSAQNTSNAAICLDELGRHDEALEMYELLLVEFKDELTDKDRAAVLPAIETLRNKVGNVFISANVADAKVVIDGRARAELPLTVPIRVLPGKRVIRIIKNGYVTWERSREVKQGQTLRVDAKLEALAQAGLLRVEGTPGTEVFVDGAPMGPSPWEGTLGPGAHVVWTASDTLGSAPKRVVVVQGQTAVVRLESAALGPEVTIEVTPQTAKVLLGDADLGRGRWRGRLPVGSYAVSAAEEGYFPRERRIAVQESGKPITLRLELEVDADHPRWPTSEAGEIMFQVFGGFAFGPGLRSDAEESCATCPDGTSALGLMVGGRGGYRFPFGLALELSAGYLRVASSFERESVLDDQPGVRYPISDALLVHGPFVGFGLGFRHVFSELVGLGGRVSAGAFFEAVTDELGASATKNGQEAELTVQDPEPVTRGVSVFLLGDLGIDFELGAGFSLGAAMGIVVFLTEGATVDQRTTSLPLSCDPAMPDDIGCIRSGTAIPDERAHQIFFVGVPQLQLGYRF